MEMYPVGRMCQCMIEGLGVMEDDRHRIVVRAIALYGLQKEILQLRNIDCHQFVDGPRLHCLKDVADLHV